MDRAHVAWRYRATDVNPDRPESWLVTTQLAVAEDAWKRGDVVEPLGVQPVFERDVGLSPALVLEAQQLRRLLSVNGELSFSEEIPPEVKGWGTTASYLTDDRDKPEDELYKLSIMAGPNGDYYVSVLPKNHRFGPTVRLCTSGGASRAAPGLTVAVSNAYRALLAANCGEG